MLTDAEISVAIADLDPEPPTLQAASDEFVRVYREYRQLIEGLIAQEKQREADARRDVRRREWALWIAAGAVVAAVVWGLQ